MNVTDRSSKLNKVIWTRFCYLYTKCINSQSPFKWKKKEQKMLLPIFHTRKQTWIWVYKTKQNIFGKHKNYVAWNFAEPIKILPLMTDWASLVNSIIENHLGLSSRTTNNLALTWTSSINALCQVSNVSSKYQQSESIRTR